MNQTICQFVAEPPIQLRYQWAKYSQWSLNDQVIILHHSSFSFSFHPIYIYISSPAIPDHNITSISTYTHPIPQSQFQPPLRKQHAIPHLTLAISDIGFGSSLTETDMYVYGWHGYCIWQNEQSGSLAVSTNYPSTYLLIHRNSHRTSPTQNQKIQVSHRITSQQASQTHQISPPFPSHPTMQTQLPLLSRQNKTTQTKSNLQSTQISYIYIYIHNI